MLGDGNVENYAPTPAYLRIGGELMSGYTAKDVIITINEEIK